MARFNEGLEETQLTASAQASGEAYYELGLMYAAGRDVEPNHIIAHKWFNIAVVRGYAPAILKRAELAQEMSREQIAKAQKEARSWLSYH